MAKKQSISLSKLEVGKTYELLVRFGKTGMKMLVGSYSGNKEGLLTFEYLQPCYIGKRAKTVNASLALVHDRTPKRSEVIGSIVPEGKSEETEYKEWCSNFQRISLTPSKVSEVTKSFSISQNLVIEAFVL